MVTREQKELWIEQKEANFEARQILGVGPRELIVGDLPDDCFDNAVARGMARHLRDLDEEHSLEQWYGDSERWLGLYFCEKCGYEHYFEGSKIGQKHLKYRLPPDQRAKRDREFYLKYAAKSDR